ncbi:MAG: hypothetical protein ACRC6I_19965 [Paracoccaceae bacterium]
MRLNRFVLAAVLVWPLGAGAEPLISGPSAEGPSFEAVQEAFRARVLEAFPADTPLTEVSERLTAEGFTMLEGYAEVIDQGFPCDVVWRVLWTEVDGMATDIGVVHNGICL